MCSALFKLAILALVANIATSLPTPNDNDNDHDDHDDHDYDNQHHTYKPGYHVLFGPRLFYLVNNITKSSLKTKLESCKIGPFGVTGFTISHRRGGTLMFPKETVESTMAGARISASILECDVLFTHDHGLVCRHSLCDLHTMTNILLYSELAKKCTVPFTLANATLLANVLCYTSNITIAKYQTLCGKQDGFNASAKNVKDYYTVMTLDSYITLIDSFPGHRNFTLELKTPLPQVPMLFNRYTQEQYTRDMLNKFIERGIAPNRVKEYLAFAKQAVYLDEDGDMPETLKTAVACLGKLKSQGVNIIAPPFGYLLTTTLDNKTIIPSLYTTTTKATFERSGPLANVAANNEYYYSDIAVAIHSDGQMYEVLDVLGRQVGIKAIFTDWAATVSFYANCFGIEYYSHS